MSFQGKKNSTAHVTLFLPELVDFNDEGSHYLRHVALQFRRLCRHRCGNGYFLLGDGFSRAKKFGQDVAEGSESADQGRERGKME